MADEEEEPRTIIPRPPPPPPIDDPVDHVESESLNDFILRLAALADSHQLRVSAEHMDEEGNLILPPVIAYFVDSGGTPHAGLNTSGYLRVTGGDVVSTPVPIWNGGTLVSTQYSFTNDGANSGDHSLKLEPASGCPVELVLWLIYNGDAAGRVTTLDYSTAGATQLCPLYTATLGATTFDAWPDEGTSLTPLPVPSTNEILSKVAAVAVSKASYHVLVYRYFGATAPVITTSGPTNCTIAVMP